MPVFVFTERQGAAHQIGTALAQRIIEALDMCGFTCFFANGAMPFGGQHFGIWLPKIAVANRAFAIVRWERFPEFATGLTAPITKGETDDSACLAFQGEPDPNLLPFGANK